METLPEYYKNIVFFTADGRHFHGYLEPPFSDDNIAMFVAPMIEEQSQGYDALFFDIVDVVSWEYDK